MSFWSWLFDDPLPAGAPAPSFPELEQNAGRYVLLVFYVADDTPT